MKTKDIAKMLIPAPLHPVARNAHDLFTGRWPRARAYRTAAKLATQQPTSFNEKLRYKMAHDRRPLLTMLADKVAVRAYVAERLGARYLIPSYGDSDDVERLPWDDLPREFVCKANHGSGAVVVVWEGASGSLPTAFPRTTWARHLVHPDRLVRTDLQALCRRWLTQNYEYKNPRLPEWPYRDIPPRILLEECLTSSAGRLPLDYKFFVFDGTCELVQVDYDRFSGHKRDLFTPEWELLPVGLEYPRGTEHQAKPSNLTEMVAAAETLGAGLDFVRVDLYNVDGRIFFGELTHFPGAAEEVFYPEEFDRWLGGKFTLACA